MCLFVAIRGYSGLIRKIVGTFVGSTNIGQNLYQQILQNNVIKILLNALLRTYLHPHVR